MHRAFLRIVAGAGQGTIVALPSATPFVIGRKQGDLLLDDPLVSGLRALGHVVSISAQSSGIGTILRVQRNGQAQLEGGADPRREGLVLGDTVR